MATISVQPVTTKADFKAFFEFPWVLYQDDPNWVPPLLSIRRELLDKEKNPAWDYLEGDYFLARRGDEVVGTIAAFVNHRHNEFADEHVAWFGIFETINDTAVASALLNTAVDWAQSRGYHALRGPQNFTTHEECGLLVDNFSPPMILMPYNPPYYADLIESAGFTKTIDVYSMYYDRALSEKNNFDGRFRRLVDRAMQRSDITIRKIDVRRKKEEFSAFKDIYNRAWANNWGFVPMTERELDTLVESLGQFFEPDLAFFAEVKGELAGFILSVPDLNEVLHRAYPRPGMPELWTLLKAGWYWKIRRIIRGVRIPLMGVLPEYRDRGVEMALMYRTFEAIIDTDYEYADAGWILESNELVKIGKKFGSHAYKTHRFYEKRLETP